MGWLVIAIPVAIGFLLGSLVPARQPVLLVVPAVGVAVVYWVGVGWFGHDYELAQSAFVMIIGLIAAAFVALWTTGVALGRLARATWQASADS
jgi:hypothetical protein